MPFRITLFFYILKHLKFSRASFDTKELHIPSQMGIPCLTPFIFVFSLHPLLLNIPQRPGKRVVRRQHLNLTKGIYKGGSDRLENQPRDLSKLQTGQMVNKMETPVCSSCFSSPTWSYICYSPYPIPSCMQIMLNISFIKWLRLLLNYTLSCSES